ncbi:DsbA family oxidoreductase [Streptomyces sp. TP-A0874]|uniref:DsbA family oxidoreductase n=1 Tax=Streptomyces sp. TP-A0874 TaxID=549819 RepID=UPI0008536048|nr:DsbA family oxidoreductase [Streptomyces sp. TP-A0874]
MRIEIWADVVCAWAYIGKRRLESALESPRLADSEVEVVWRPFRIDPTTPVEATPLAQAWRDPDSALRERDPDSSPVRNRALVSETAATEGLGPGWGAVWRANSHDAHRLLHLAYEHGGAALQGEVAEGVMKAHFQEGTDISLRQQLKRIAADAGFAEGADLLDTDAGDREVRELLLIGKARGIATSPTIVVGDQAIGGAQSPAVIEDFLVRGGRERQLPEEVQRLRWSESLLEQRDPLGALALLGPLLDEHATDPNVRRLAARGYFHSAQLSRARRLLEQLVQDAPDDSYTRLMLGRTLQRMGMAEEAARHLKVATAMTPEFA